eukprot:Em0020g916a
MGNLLRLFRGGHQENQNRPSRISEQDRAVLSLKQQRDKLHLYQKKITTQLEKEKECAKQLLRDGKKEKAKLLLKKKRYLEGMLTKTDTQLDNLQEMVERIEYAQVEIQVVEGLKQGNECLEKMHQMMSLEDVEKIMDDTAEAIEYQRQIDELLGQNLTQEDEDAIANELDSILAGQLPEVPTGGITADVTTELPEVPTGDLTAGTEGEAKQKQTRRQPVAA